MWYSSQKKLTAGFGAATLIYLALALGSYRGSTEAVADAKCVTRTHEVLGGLGRLRAEIGAGDLDLARRTAHGVKWAGLAVGAGAMAELCRRIELAADAGEAARLWGELDAEFEGAVRELRRGAPA